MKKGKEKVKDCFLAWLQVALSPTSGRTGAPWRQGGHSSSADWTTMEAPSGHLSGVVREEILKKGVGG